MALQRRLGRPLNPGRRLAHPPRLVSIAGPCATPDGLTGSFTGSAFIQRFDARGDAITALADFSGVCTDGTTFVR